jgi:hypothetical protein
MDVDLLPHQELISGNGCPGYDTLFTFLKSSLLRVFEAPDPQTATALACRLQPASCDALIPGARVFRAGPNPSSLPAVQ